MTTAIQLEIDTAVVEAAQTLAAKRGLSFDELLRKALRDLVETAGYDAAKTRALARLKRGYDLEWAPPVSRDELHDR